MPQFSLELTAACRLTIKPMNAGNAHVSLLQVGETDPGQPIIPRATDSIVSINDAVTNKLGFYYLKPTRCPQVYQTVIKGAKLLASGACVCGCARVGAGGLGLPPGWWLVPLRCWCGGCKGLVIGRQQAGAATADWCLL